MSISLSKTYSPARRIITENYRLDEKTAVDQLMETLDFTEEQEKRITDHATKLINKLRHIKQKQYGGRIDGGVFAKFRGRCGIDVLG